MQRKHIPAFIAVVIALAALIAFNWQSSLDAILAIPQAQRRTDGWAYEVERVAMYRYGSSHERYVAPDSATDAVDDIMDLLRKARYKRRKTIVIRGEIFDESTVVIEIWFRGPVSPMWIKVMRNHVIIDFYHTYYARNGDMHALALALYDAYADRMTDTYDEMRGFPLIR